MRQYELWPQGQPIEGEATSKASPSMRFCVLGSGSTGNACIVQARAGDQVTTLLIDCGLALRVLQKRLRLVGLAVEDINAIFITHEHSDHVAALPQVLSEHNAPVFASAGTRRALMLGRQAKAFQSLPNLNIATLKDGDTHALGPMQLHPFAVPHDASEPLQLVLTLQHASGEYRMGYLTDLGHPSARVIDALQNLHAIVLEANHDAQMLQSGRYPPYLKRRVAGPLGHLTNNQSAQLLGQIVHPGLHTVVAAHLSLQNNRPEIALAALNAAIEPRTPRTPHSPIAPTPAIHWAAANEPSQWFTV